MKRPLALLARSVSLLLLLPAAGGILMPRAAEATGGEDAVLLEETLDIEILSESEATVHYLNRTQVLTPRGAERYGYASIFYNPSITIRAVSASTTSPDGKRVEIKKQQFSDSSAFASFELYSDAKWRNIRFTGSEPGAVLEYRYEESVHSLLYLPDIFPLQEAIPARAKTLTLAVPASLPVRISVRGSPAATREEKGGTILYRWQVSDVPAFKGEADTPPEEDLLPRVALYPKRIAFGDHRIDLDSWEGIAAWYRDLARDRMAPAAAVTEAARSATAGAGDPDEKIRRLYEFLQEKIAYVAVELGTGGWQPHESGQVLLHRYGDCKDKATLLIAMLKAVGLDGFPALIRTRDEGLLEKDFPAPRFNHAIVAVPHPAGYLFLDPTSPTTPFGDLPWVDQGVPVLVVKEDGHGDFVETPLAPAERNRRHRQVTARVTPTGGLEGDYVIEAWGQRRVNLSDLVGEDKPAGLEDSLAGLMAALCPGAVMKGHTVAKGSRPGDPARITIHFEVPRYILRAGSSDLISPQLARFPWLAEITAYAGRRSPVFFDYLSADTSEVRLRLPPGRSVAKLPAGGKLEGPGLQATTIYEKAREEDSEVLVVRRSLTVSRREIPPADYPALRDFVAAVAREDAGAVTLAAGG